MLTLTSLSSPARSSAILSRIGETAWHGPHHSAQKSTRTGFSLFRTSSSKLASVTASAIAVSSFRWVPQGKTPRVQPFFPGRRIETHGSDSRVQAATGGSRPSRARARDPRALGRGGPVRAAARAQPRRADVVVRRRAGHREEDARGAPRVGADAEGRVPAVARDAGLRPALPERLRLPGPLDRGRRRARPRSQLEA